MEYFPFLILPIFAVIAVVIIVLNIRSAKKRRAELGAWAASLGWEFREHVPDELLAALRDFEPFGKGNGRRASNFVTGRRGEVVWELFDYRFETGSGKNRRTHYYGIVAARLPMLSFPHLVIRPEGVADRIASVLGFDDLNFESEAFSTRYHVSSDDRQRAYDVIHPQMIEYLLSLPPTRWELGGPRVVRTREGRFPSTQLPRIIESIEGFIAHLPAYVRQDLRTRRG